jgi:hypothetical protein
VDEILNFAMLTGKIQAYPLHVYLVRDSDTLVSAVGYAACHSRETDVLKVGYFHKMCRSNFSDLWSISGIWVTLVADS